MVRRIYSLAWYVATPLIVAYLLWRGVRQPEYRRHWGERWGLFASRRARAPLIWIHAVSVGETRAAQPLLSALARRYPQADFLLTHMTPTGRETGATLYRDAFAGRLHQAYLPYDYPSTVQRFFRSWRPALGLVMETEVWPNLFDAARAAGVPLALVNARLSERSSQKGTRWRSLIAPAVAALDVVVAQTREDALRIARLGRNDVVVAGNIKFDIEPVPALVERGRAWRARFPARDVVLVASSRDGEERLVVAAWLRRMSSDPRAAHERPLLAVVPRHPQRFDEVERTMVAAGMRTLRRSAFDAAPTSDVDALLGDSMGEMFAWYAMADVAIIGGSLLPFGGQNLIEACAVGTPVVIGAHTFNFEQAAEQAQQAGAATRVPDAEAAVDAALALLADADRRHAQAEVALAFAREHRGATQRTIAAIEPLLLGSIGPGEAPTVK